MEEFLPGTGRGTALAVEGSVEAGFKLSNMSIAPPGPSVAARHLPVPGRIQERTASADNFSPVTRMIPINVAKVGFPSGLVAL